MLAFCMKRYGLYVPMVVISLFGLVMVQGCSLNDSPGTDISESAGKEGDDYLTTLESPMGYRISYPESWAVVKDSSSIRPTSRAIIFTPGGSISRVVLPAVIFSARTEETASIQQSLKIIVGPRTIGGDGPITPEREFNFHLRVLNLVKGKFLDKVQDDKDELPRFVSEIQSPSQLPGTSQDTHIFDHFWVTDVATWQVTCAASRPPSEQAERICNEILESFFLY